MSPKSLMRVFAPAMNCYDMSSTSRCFVIIHPFMPSGRRDPYQLYCATSSFVILIISTYEAHDYLAFDSLRKKWVLLVA